MDRFFQEVVALMGGDGKKAGTLQGCSCSPGIETLAALVRRLSADGCNTMAHVEMLQDDMLTRPKTHIGGVGGGGGLPDLVPPGGDSGGTHRTVLITGRPSSHARWWKDRTIVSWLQAPTGPNLIVVEGLRGLRSAGAQVSGPLCHGNRS